LPLSGDNKIPPGRDWALAPLTFMLALLTSRQTSPALGGGMYPDFRIVINCYLKHAAKLRRLFRMLSMPRDANPCHIDANRCHMP
jgi:hypothetical protein